MNAELKKFGVYHRVVKGCKCSKTFITYIYTLPVGLDSDIVGVLSNFGHNVVPFNKSAMLKIDNANLSIIGIKRLKDIKLIFKKNNDSQTLVLFEEALLNYLKSKKE